MIISANYIPDARLEFDSRALLLQLEVFQKAGILISEVRDQKVSADPLQGMVLPTDLQHA